MQEVYLIPQPHDGLPGCRYFMTLMRDDLQIRVGDCVYITRENPQRRNDGIPVRTSYRLLSNTSPDKLEIFRVERLWINEKWVQMWRFFVKVERDQLINSFNEE